jgi:hypothetical protein
MPSPGNAERSRAAIDRGLRGTLVCEHDGSDAITVTARNRAYIRDVLT